MVHECKEAKQYCKFVWRHLNIDFCHKVIPCPNCGEKVNPFLICNDSLKCDYAKLKLGIVKDDPEQVRYPLTSLKHYQIEPTR